MIRTNLFDEVFNQHNIDISPHTTAATTTIIIDTSIYVIKPLPKPSYLILPCSYFYSFRMGAGQTLLRGLKSDHVIMPITRPSNSRAKIHHNFVWPKAKSLLNINHQTKKLPHDYDKSLMHISRSIWMALHSLKR